MQTHPVSYKLPSESIVIEAGFGDRLHGLEELVQTGILLEVLYGDLDSDIPTRNFVDCVGRTIRFTIQGGTSGTTYKCTIAGASDSGNIYYNIFPITVISGTIN